MIMVLKEHGIKIIFSERVHWNVFPRSTLNATKEWNRENGMDSPVSGQPKCEDL